MSTTLNQAKFLPYGRQTITNDDIAAVTEVLQSDWLTCGPIGPAFENDLAAHVRVKETIACANGTAALHLAMLALGIGAGDVVITTPISFLATANCARYVGAEVWFADIDAATGLISPDSIKRLLVNDKNKRVKAVIPVHLAGQPADLPEIHAICRAHRVSLVEDACHALGASYQTENETVPIGSCRHSDLTVFSFHPVKHVATGEGGAVTTNDPELARRLRQFRNHGMERETFTDSDLAYDSSGHPNPWYYEMTALGFNYRLSDIQSALGKSQLKQLRNSVARRQEIAKRYDKLITEQFESDRVRPLIQRTDCANAFHLYVTLINFGHLGVERAAVMNQLRKVGIGTQVHYIPIFFQPFYREHSLEAVRDCPNSLKYYEQALSLPMYPALTDADIEYVVTQLAEILKR
jgi:UDP-4-amino-4,6-dideoxy-N-acetyl-beta-L-altrosamine transaminase